MDNRHPEEILKSYDTEEVNNFLIHIPLQLGLKREDVTIGTRFANGRVELYYTINNDKKINFQNRSVELYSGDQILVSISYKYIKSEFISFLKLYFDEVIVKISKDGSYALALCKK